MAKIAPGPLPPPEPSGPALSLPTGGLPADLLESLQSGAVLTARVVAQISAERFLVRMAGQDVLVESRLGLSVGQQLQLAIKQTGTKTLLDLVDFPAPAASSSAAGRQIAGSSAGQPAAFSSASAAGQMLEPDEAALRAQPAPADGQLEPLPAAAREVLSQAPAAAAQRTLQAEIGATLSSGAPVSNLLVEALRALSGEAFPPSAASPATTASATTAPTTAAQAAAPAGTASAPPASAPTAAPAGADAPRFAGRFPAQAPVPAAPYSPTRPLPQAAPQTFGSPASPARPQLQPPAATPSTPAAAQPQSAAGQPLPAGVAVPPTSLRDLAGLVREMLVNLPPAAATSTAPATMTMTTSPAQTPAQGASASPAATIQPAQLAEAAAALPARVAAALAAVEARAEQVLAALPTAATLGALIEALDALPAAAGTPAQTGAAAAALPSSLPAPAAAGSGLAVLTAALRLELAPLLDRIHQATTLPAADGRVATAAALPAALRAAVQALPEEKRVALRMLAAERESAAVAASPQMDALSAAHRALSAAQDRLDLARMWSLAASGTGPQAGTTGQGAGQSFSFVELPVAAGGEALPGRMRIMVRRSSGDGGDAEGGGPGGGSRSGRTVRAVLGLSMSALGDVSADVALAARNLTVKLELPDDARRDFVAAHLDELSASLDARGLQTQATAGSRSRSRRRRAASADDDGPAAPSETGGLDLWA